MMRLKNNAVSAAVVLSMVLLLFGCGGGGGGSASSTAPQTPVDNSLVTLDLGESKTVATQMVQPTGGLITVDAQDDPLDGLEVNVLDGAYDDSTNFTVSSTPINGHSGNPHFSPVTPLITVQNGGEYSDKFMTLKIPVAIEEGYHYMAFFFDENTGRLEGIPELTHDENSLTIATRHFSDVVVNRVAMVQEHIDGTFDTGFRVGTDNWSFVNEGSYLFPGGICSGMSLTAIYYYVMERVLSNKTGLYNSFLGEDSDKGIDDEKAIKLASMAQLWDDTYENVAFNELYDEQEKRPSDIWSYFSFIHALKVTQMPQYAVIVPEVGTNHALVVYKKEGDSLFVADPNAPEDGTATLDFFWDQIEPEKSKWESYTGSWDLVSGPTVFTRAFYFGQSALIDWKNLKKLFDRLEDGTVGDIEFPEYTLLVHDKDEYGDDIETVLPGSYVSQNQKINISVDSDEPHDPENPDNFNPAITVYQPYGRPTLYDEESVELTLESGVTRIGVYITHETNDAWTDFKYFDITYNPIVCEEGEELVDGECVPVGCNLVCDGEPFISDTLVVPSHDGTHSVTLEFLYSFKMCTRTVDDPSSVSGKVTMLYFFPKDGSYTYSWPHSYADEDEYDRGIGAYVNGGSDDFNIEMRGLSYSPSASYMYGSFNGTIDNWAFDVYSFDTISANNEYDFFWLNVRLTPTGSYATTVINPEVVDGNGCYSGIH